MHRQYRQDKLSRGLSGRVEYSRVNLNSTQLNCYALFPTLNSNTESHLNALLAKLGKTKAAWWISLL
jgi:hypothetical protein